VVLDVVLDDLAPDQLAAVTTPSTLVAVIAGAGSGKTRVLTRRIAHRIATGSAEARHTLALTFTREAAGELRRRLRQAGVREHVEAGTFHAVALSLLRQRWADLDRSAPTVVGDRHRLLTEVAAGIPVAALGAEADWSAARGIPPDRYARAARAAGRRGAIDPARVASALDAYATLKRRRGVVDFDDLLGMCTAELGRDAAWTDAVRYRYRHVLVDEAQDLNPVQQRLLELVVGDRADLFLVGDPAQAIYGFNGSDPGLLLDVAARFAGIEVIGLPVNHRCTAPIVAAGVAVLAAGDRPREGTSARGDGPAVRIVGLDDEEAEAARVAAIVRGVDPRDVRSGGVAVLARTNAQLPRLAAALEAARVPIRRVGQPAASPLGVAIRTATAQPSASRLRAWAHDVFDADRATDPDPGVVAERRVAAAVLEFLRDQPYGDGAALRSWLATADVLAEPGASGGIELLTFHAAKGREWPVVVVTGVETGLVPHRSAGTNAARQEEARLLHVAVTRAADELVITWAARRGGYRRRPSPLIAGIDTTGRAPVAPPVDLLSPVPRDAAHDALVDWRRRAAVAAGILPDELCAEADLRAIAAARPTTPDELAAATSLGLLTATRLLPGIRDALDLSFDSAPIGRESKDRSVERARGEEVAEAGVVVAEVAEQDLDGVLTQQRRHADDPRGRVAEPDS
jgi:ATP-dependent DNA helicase UvrD/PcrA